LENYVLQILIPASGLASGLIGAFVGLQNRALLAEVRKELAELESRMFLRLNGKYVRQAECLLREENLANRLQELRQELRDLSRRKSVAEECE
jgi:hypothetical protein